MKKEKDYVNLGTLEINCYAFKDLFFSIFVLTWNYQFLLIYF